MRPNELVEILIEEDGPVSARSLIEVSVHLPRRGTRWVASFRDESGRQVWRTTGLRDKKMAIAVGQRWEADAKRRRSVQRPVPPRLTIRVRPASTERQQGCFSQKEVALILRISERAVREIERRAIEKLRRHTVLKSLWRELKTGEIKEAASAGSRPWALNRTEIAAVYGLARTSVEQRVLKKLLALIAT